MRFKLVEIMKRTKVKGILNNLKRNPQEGTNSENISSMGISRGNHKRMPLLRDINYVAMV